MVGAHAELLNEGRVGASQDEGGDHRHRDAGDRQAPRAAEGCDDEEDGDQEGDDRQDGVGGQLGVDVGVQGTVGGAEVLGEQLVTASQ